MKKLLSVILVCSMVTFLTFPSCQKELSTESGNDSNLVAKGSLKDSSGICLPDSVVGTFYNGVIPGSDTAYVQIQVNVTNTGLYNISTDQQNGMIFADSGFFNSTGINIIRLKPIGTAILPITTDFTVTFDTSVCFFSVDFKDSTGTGLGGDTTGTDTAGLNTWQFSDTINNYSGPVTSATFDTLQTFLVLAGNTTSGTDTNLIISVKFPSAAIIPGTYSTSTSGTTFLFSATVSNPVIYAADSTTAGKVMNIVINNYDSTSRIVSGSFSGQATDSSGNAQNITNGVFKAAVQ